MTKPSRSLETELIHAGENPARQQGAVVTPIYQSATYLYQGEVRYSDVRYVRLNNTPNHLALHEKLAVIELATVAPSLGGVETLVTRPATTSHSGLTPEERATFGISDTLIRVSVGIEHKNDLLRDFSRGLES